MASLVSLSSGIYYAKFYDAERSPNRKRVSLKTRNRRLAERLLAKLESKYLLGTFDPWSPPEPAATSQAACGDLRMLGDAVDAYMASCSHLSKYTLRTYRSIFKLFREHLGDGYPVTHITPADVLGFLDSTDANPVTRHKYLKHLGYLFRYLVRRGVLKRD